MHDPPADTQTSESDDVSTTCATEPCVQHSPQVVTLAYSYLKGMLH